MFSFLSHASIPFRRFFGLTLVLLVGWVGTTTVGAADKFGSVELLEDDPAAQTILARLEALDTLESYCESTRQLPVLLVESSR